MRRAAVLLAFPIIFISASVISFEGPVEDNFFHTRESDLIDVAESRFDSLSAPSFISAGDWNSDGYVDLLFNGYRLFENSGPPGWNFTLRGDVFQSSTSGAKNGAWADWDGDGDLDLYQGCGKDTKDRFFENQGGPDYELIDTSIDVFGRWGNFHPNTGCAWADYDGDGDLDIYVGNGEDWNDGDPIYFEDYLLRNDGGDTLTDVTISAGADTGEDLYSRGVTWGDFDNDGWQDAYVSHYRIRENHLFVNQHDGTFTEEGGPRNCSGTYDPDRYTDNTAGQVYGQSKWGPTYGHTIGSAWADLNRDGNLDVWTSDFVHKYVGYIGSWYDIRGYVCDDGNLYISDGAPDYTFTDYRNVSGIPVWPIGGQGVYQGDQTFSGVTVGDYDNDGWEDMYIPQVYGDLPYTTPHLFRNKGPSTTAGVPDGVVFEDVTDDKGIAGANTYANLLLDFDNDGDLDLLTGGGETWTGSKWTDYRVRLYENQGSGSNHWLEVKLDGVGMNKDAVGARVTLRYEAGDEEKIMVREVRAGTGHAHQQPNMLHFGLGTEVEGTDPVMEIRWPDGLIETRDVQMDTIMEISRTDMEGPTVNDYSVSSPIVEDSPVTVNIDASQGESSISSYIWDLDSDNHFDSTTVGPSITIGVHHSGMRHIRCRVVDGNDLARDVYPIEIDVPNETPLITLQDRLVDMDDPLMLSQDLITDTPSDLTNISWSISWGDGDLSEGKGPTWPPHIYREPGKYNLHVEASDESETASLTVEADVLNVDPWGYLEPEDGNSTLYFEDEPVMIVPHIFDTLSDTGEMDIRWNFGDGTPITSWTDPEEVRHTYHEAGTYNVTGFVRDQYGGVGSLEGKVSVVNAPPSLEKAYDGADMVKVREDERVEFDDRLVGVDTASDEVLLEYMWDLGDGGTTEWQSYPDTSHTYSESGTYNAVCTVKDDDGDTNSTTIEVTVENVVPLIESIGPLPDIYEDGEVEIVVEAEDTASDEEGLVFHYDLGDGRTLTGGSTMSVIFHTSGYKTVTVTVSDDDGAEAVDTVQLLVLNRAPSGEIIGPAGSVDEDASVNFSASSLDDSLYDLYNLTVSWDLGDGSERIEGANVSHSYTESGTYKVKMYIDDGDEVTTVQDSITVNNLPPTASIDISSTELEIGEVLNLSAAGSADTPSDIPYLSFTWDMGDGTSLEGEKVQHSYGESGTYEITLDVVDDDGLIDTKEVTVVVTGAGEDTYGGEEEEKRSGGTVLLLVISLMVLLLISAVLVVIVISKRRKASTPLAYSYGPGVPPAAGKGQVQSGRTGPPPSQGGMPSLTQQGPPSDRSQGPERISGMKQNAGTGGPPVRTLSPKRL